MPRDLIIIVFLLLLLTANLGWSQTLKRQELSRPYMGTIFQIIALGKGEKQVADAIEAAFQEIERLQNLLSLYKKNSRLNQVNQQAHLGPVKVEAELFDLLLEAKRISQLTEGAFDITIAGLGKIWKFNRSGFTPPSDLLLAQRLPLVDYRKMLLNSTHKSVSLQKKGMKLDLGGIAKGYALDRAVAMLKKHGIAHGLVYGGGDIKLFGNRDGKPKGTPWRVGVQHPRESGKILAKIAITDTAVVTSGDYERFAIKGGERYHHLIDPKEGRPGRKAISATVVGPNAMRADGLATGVFIMGTEGIKLLESLPEVEGLIVNSEGKVFYTTGMRKITTLLRPIHLYKNRVK